MKTKTLFIRFIIILTGITFSSCEDMWNRCVDGNGDIVIHTTNTEDFDRIQIKGDYEVEIDTGSVSTVQIIADENLLGFIIVHVSGSKLYVETREETCLRPSKPVKIVITTPAVAEIALYGSGAITCDGLDAEELIVYLEGSGYIDCTDVNVNYANISVEGSGTVNGTIVAFDLYTLVEGSGHVTLNGGTVSSDMEIIGSGLINGSQMDSDTCNVYISGSGTVNTHVIDFLNVTIIGSGIVHYTGNPIVQSYISGSGQVMKQ
jgi:hypothetical protein